MTIGYNFLWDGKLHAYEVIISYLSGLSPLPLPKKEISMHLLFYMSGCYNIFL